jgi:hypothetical protein
MLAEIYQFFKSLYDCIGNVLVSLRGNKAVPQTEEAASVAEIELNESLPSETFMEEEPELVEIENNKAEVEEEEPKTIEVNVTSDEEEPEEVSEEETQEDNDRSSDEDYVYEEDHDDDESEEESDEDDE